MNAKRLFRFIAVIAMAGLPLAVCLTTSVDLASAATKSLSPVNIMVINTQGTPDVNNPEVPAAVEAAAKQINSEGGLKGHHIKVFTCNDQLNPNVATECAQKAVQDHVIAAVGSWSTYSTNFYATFKAAGIVNLGEDPLTAADYSNPLSYPVAPGIALQYVADGVLAAKEGCSVIAGLSINSPANLQVLTYVKLGADSVNPSITVPPDYITFPQPDYAPVISQAIGDHANCLVIETPSTDATRLMTAVEQSGQSLKIFGNSTSIDTANLKAIGAPGNGKIFEADPQALPDTSPALVAIAKAIKAQNPAAPLDSFSLNSWAATQVLKLAAAHMTTFTAASLIAALPKIGTISFGYYAPFSFEKPFSLAALSQLFNATLYGWVAHNGQYVPMSNPNTPINVKPILAKL